MIPFIRSHKELMIITQSKNNIDLKDEYSDFNTLTEDSGQRKRYIKSTKQRGIDLPELPTSSRPKWMKSKKAISKFFDELDYNNQIQSSYDLTLLDSQKNYDQQDVA